MAAGQEGKWKAALQMVGLVGLMVHYPHTVDFGVYRVYFHFHEAGLVFLYLSIFFSLLSAGTYLRWFVGEPTAGTTRTGRSRGRPHPRRGNAGFPP